jgi:ubiquinone/menaquinone biosynthesis C-methylase UbiE
MTDRPERKFDPGRAHMLDSAERSQFLPDETLVELLELSGEETVLDYGSGTGRVALAAAARLPNGRVLAVDENPEMLEILRERTAETPNVEVLAANANRVELPDASAQRILAVNLLHEVRGENALAEMRRLLSPDGLLLVADWDRDAPGDTGPPAHLRYSSREAERELADAGFITSRAAVSLPYHFAITCRHGGA